MLRACFYSPYRQALGCFWTLGISLMLAFPVYAESARPFLVSNQSPFSGIQSLPFTPDAQVLLPEQQALTVDLAWASHSFTQKSANEALVIDGESAQLNLVWRRGFNVNVPSHSQAADFEFGIVIPIRHQGGGLMDSGINQFHSTFGLPHGSRAKTPNNQINYRYSRVQNGAMTPLVDVSPKGAGLGDVRLLLSKQLLSTQQRGGKSSRKSDYNLAWQTELKLPTGEVDEWNGDNAYALSSAIAYDKAFYNTSYTHWQAFGHLGLRWSQVGEVLPKQQEQILAFGGFGLVMQWRSLQLQAQFDAHSATYKSDLAAFGPAIQITFGANYLTQHGVLSFSILEDILPETAPDVVFKLAWDKRFSLSD